MSVNKKMPGDESAKISWFSKICCVSKISLNRTNTWWWLSKNMMHQQKFDKSAKWTDSAEIRYVSKTCWVIKMPDDESAKDSWVSKKIAVSAKISWFSKICCVNKIWLVSENTWWHSNNMLYQQKFDKSALNLYFTSEL